MKTHPYPRVPRADRRHARRLAGLRAVITGGSSGVGRALAVELARRGCRCVATARRAERLAELARSPLSPSAVPIIPFAGDITSADFRERLLEECGSRLGGLDIVVAAAGGGAIGTFRGGDPATLRSVMELDFFAPAELVRSALPMLGASPDPAVVLVGSILGLHPLPLHAEYCAAKAALAALAGSLRAEVSPEGIDVLLASLGPTRSEFWDHLVTGTRPAWSAAEPLPAETAAAAIVEALVRRRPEVLPGWPAKGFALAARLCPRLIDAAVARRRRRES